MPYTQVFHWPDTCAADSWYGYQASSARSPLSQRAATADDDRSGQDPPANPAPAAAFVHGSLTTLPEIVCCSTPSTYSDSEPSPAVRTA